MSSELVELNSINIAAITIGLADLDAVLTTLVLITALVYNVKRLMNDEKKRDSKL